MIKEGHFQNLLAPLFFLLVLTSCTLAPCRGPKEPVVPRTGENAVGPQPEGSKYVWVYRYDNSKQCETIPGVSLEEGQKDLGSIEVFASKKQYDGLMRIQACGAPTGKANTYKILRSDLPAAESSGYQEWKFKTN